MDAPSKAMTFSVLFKKEEGLVVAHCLELDIVATGETFKEAEKDILDLIRAQVHYAFANDNLDYLYHPAPASVWKEFFDCRTAYTRTTSMEPDSGPETDRFIPPWIVAQACADADIQHG